MPILNAQQQAVAQAPAFDSVPSLQHWSAMMRDGVPIDSVRAAFDASWDPDAVVPRGKRGGGILNPPIPALKAV